MIKKINGNENSPCAFSPQNLPIHHPSPPTQDLSHLISTCVSRQPWNKLSHGEEGRGGRGGSWCCCWVVFWECVNVVLLVLEGEGPGGRGGTGDCTVCEPWVVSQCAVQMCSLLAVEVSFRHQNC